MKRFALVLSFVVLVDLTAYAQVTRTLAWDKSADDSRDPAAANPVKYRLYTCKDQALTQCSSVDTATDLQKDVVIPSGTTWYFVRAYWSGFTVDGIATADVLESGNSNVLKVECRVPPGNPVNAKIRVSAGVR